METALTQRDCYWKKDANEDRAEWALRPGNTYSFSWASNVAPAAVGATPCTDDSTYTGDDGYIRAGYKCADWEGHKCPSGEVQQKCRRACGLCPKVRCAQDRTPPPTFTSAPRLERA